MKLEILKQNGNIKVNLELKKWLIKFLLASGIASSTLIYLLH